MSKKIKAKITVKETVVYEQEVELTEEQFNKLDSFNGDDIASYEDGYYDIDSLIDRHNVSHNMEEFEIEKIE